MRIAVVGGGAAGLVTSWLLEEHHDVTLFERADRLGGHAHTLEIEAHGRQLAIDAGFEFFGHGPAYRTFNRLLDALHVERESYPATMTLDRQGRRAVALPPFRNGRPVWESLTPRALLDLIRFRRFLSGIPDFLARHDTSVTIDDHLRRLRMPASFVEGFVYPFLLAFWCVEPEELRGFAAYNALYYLGAAMPEGLRSPDQSRVVGGMTSYVDALAGDLARARVRLDVEVARVTREGEGFAVAGETFDQVVLASNARSAHDVLDGVVGAEAMRTQLARIEYFDTTIAIHGDRRLMPERSSSWSVVNVRSDGVHSQLSIWNPSHDVPVFRSWVTFDERMPEPLYAVATYEHGKVTPAYFDAQRRLGELHGKDGVWLAGLYMVDADSHESAVLSAVAIAKELAPESERLRMLRP